MHDHIYTGRVFRSLYPGSRTSVIVRAYDGGPWVSVADVRSQRPHRVPAVSLRASAGSEERWGYAPVG
ncbi:hypothetical protein [Nocardiopsis sp. CA-288880]|uniref:hypothetical protein n=1 Tax=Nocardiopsis sp. CA-288880 TaxID=3239995 RepID=UPI003D96869F